MALLLRSTCCLCQRRRGQQHQAERQRSQNAQYSFLHRDPSMMKVIWFLLWRNQGDIPLPKIYFSVRVSKPFSVCLIVLWMMSAAIVCRSICKTAAVAAARFSSGTL